MPRRGRILAPLAAAILLSACGDAAPPPARLTVYEQLPPRPVYIEGALSFLRVERVETGELIVDGAATDGRGIRGREPLLDRTLPADRYRIDSYQRPCVGTCEHLDPPADRCARTVTLVPGERMRATVVLRQEGGCEIRVR